MTDEVTHLRALLADATARAEKAGADQTELESRLRRAVAMLLRGEPHEQVRSLLDGVLYDVPDQWCRVTERDAALAANAEMRAALEAVATANTRRLGESRRAIEAARALLSRPDLGAGMVVVPRAVVERVRKALGSHETCGVDFYMQAVADLDALIGKAGG